MSTETIARKTRKEIIDETAAAYTLSTRATVMANIRGKPQERCRYATDDGRCCAVGRCCIDPVEVQESYPNNNALDIGIDSGGLILRPEYRGHSADFWLDVQLLHDTVYFWDENGLTARGVQMVSDLHEEWDEAHERC